MPIVAHTSEAASPRCLQHESETLWPQWVVCHDEVAKEVPAAGGKKPKHNRYKLPKATDIVSERPADCFSAHLKQPAPLESRKPRLFHAPEDGFNSPAPFHRPVVAC